MWESVIKLMGDVVGLLFVPAVFGVWLAVSWRREKRRLRNGVLIALLVWALFGVIGSLIGRIPGADDWVGLAVLLMIPLSVLALAVLLIANGATMLRRESRSLGNLLSLLVGITLIVLPIAALFMFGSLQPILLGLVGILFFVSAYIGLAFIAFLCFTLAYSRIAPRTDAGAVVVHGSALASGELTPLLRARTDLGLAEWQRQQAAGNTALLIPSGGQGPNETRSEAAAMTEYLAPSLPDGVLVPEAESRTTEQNIAFSHAVMVARGADEPMVLVTNNYHVPRAALLTERLGVDADVIGAPTARYYLPSAYLREFIAVMSYHLKLHAILLAPFVAGTVWLAWLIAQNY